MVRWFLLCCILGLGEAVTTSPNFGSSDYDSDSNNSNTTDVIAFGHVTLTSVVWQIEYNDTTSPEFQEIKSSVSQMVAAKVTADGQGEMFTYFEMLLIWPQSEGIGLTFYMLLRIDGDTDMETVRSDVAAQLNEIENFENATVTGAISVDDYSDQDHSNDYSVMKVLGHVTYTSQQWQTGYSDNSSEEFRMLNNDVTEMVISKAQEEGLEDDLLGFEVQSATPGYEGIELKFLMVLKIYDETDVGAIPWNVTYHLNNIENLQNATVTDNYLLDEYHFEDKDQWYSNENYSSADHMDNFSVMKVLGHVTYTSQQWQTGFNDNSSEEFRMLNNNVTEMIQIFTLDLKKGRVIFKAQEEGTEDGLLGFEVQSATPGYEGIELKFLMLLKIYDETEVGAIPWNVTYHLNNIENLQNATVTDNFLLDEYHFEDREQEYSNENNSSADHMDNFSVMKVLGHVTYTSQQWQSGYNDNSSEEFRMLNNDVTEMVISKAQEEGLEDDLLGFEVQSATPGYEGLELQFWLMLKIYDDTDVGAIPWNVTYHLNNIENLQNATVTDNFLLDEYHFEDRDQGYSYENESSADHMDNFSVMKVLGHVTYTSQQWKSGFNDNSSEEFRMLNNDVTEMVVSKAQEEGLEDDLLGFEVQSAMPGYEGIELMFLMVLKIYNETDVGAIPWNVTYHLNNIENLQNATVTDNYVLDEYHFEDRDQGYSNENNSSADHMDNFSVMKVLGHVTYTSQQWQTGLNDNSSEEFRMLNNDVTEMVVSKAQEEGLEDDLLGFEVQSATLGYEGIELMFLMVLKIYNETDVGAIPWNVTYHLNNIENLQNATVTDNYLSDEYHFEDRDQGYSNENNSSADHMDNFSVMKVLGHVTYTSQQWQTGFNDNSSEEFRMLNNDVTEMVISKAQDEGLEDDLLGFEVQSATPGYEGIELMFLMVLKIYNETDVGAIPWNVTYHLNTIENLQNATVTDNYVLDEYHFEDRDQGYSNENNSSADHMDNFSVMKVLGHVTYTSQQWQTGFNDNSSEEFRMLNNGVTEMVVSKAQEEGLEDDLLGFEVQSATPGYEGIELNFLMVLKIYDETDVGAIPWNVTYHLNNIENLQNATVTDNYVLDEYHFEDRDEGYSNENNSSADHMDNFSVMKVLGHVTYTSQQWQTGFNDNSSEEFRMLNNDVTEMVISKAQEEGLEDELLGFEVQSATPGYEGIELMFLMVLKIYNETDVGAIPWNVTYHLNNIENLQNATVTDNFVLDEYHFEDRDQGYSNENNSSADHMDNFSVMKVLGHVTYTSQQWQTGFNDNSSEEFRMLNNDVTEMVISKAQEEGLEDELLGFEVQSATPGYEGIELMFLMVLKIYNETDVGAIPWNVTYHLNNIENLQNATVTDNFVLDEYHFEDRDQGYSNENNSSADHMDNFSVMKVLGHVTYTSQQWQTGFNDNSSEEFRMLNNDVTEMVVSKAQEEGLEDDLLGFEVQSATPGYEGLELSFLMVLKIYDDTDVGAIPWNVTYHLNNIENLQNATVTGTFFVDDYQYENEDQGYSNEDESSADRMDNSSVETVTPLNVTITTGVVVVQGLPKLALYCNYETQTEYEYISEWFADDEKIYTSERLPGDNIDSSYVTSDDVSLSGFALDKTFKCSASAYRPTESEPVLTKISQEMRPVEFEATEFEMERGQVLSFSIHIGIPLPCQQGSTCYVDIKLIDPDEDSQCQNSSLAFINTYTCGQRIMGASDYSKVVGEKIIKMTTKNDQQYDLKSQFRFLIKFEPKGEVETYWRGIFTTEFKVYVNDNKDFWKTMSAFSINDPRICVHGYICFSLNQAGDFLFYRNKQDRVEVQIATEECLWGGFCTCGVTVRAGKDVYMIDHCSGFHTTSYLSTSGNSNLYIREEFPGYYKIFLPRGTMVTVGVLPPALFDFAILNVGLFPSPYDVENVEGLCGDVSYSNWAGLVHSDGSTTPVSNWWLWEDPVNFINSWRLSDTESLWYMLSNDVELEDLDEEATLCVCTGTDDSADVVCSKQEKRLCADEYNVNSELPGNKKNEAQLRMRMQLRNEARESQINTRKKREVGTSGTIDFNTAFDMCRSSMNNKCGKVINETETGMIANNTYTIVACAYDKMENSSVNWEDSSCTEAANKINVLIDKDKSVLADIKATVEETWCPNLCSGHGDCIGRKCHCYEGYSNGDCGLQTTRTVNVESLGNGQCDAPCNYIYIQGEGFSPDAICRIRHKQITTNNEVKTIGYIDCLFHYEGTYEASVEVPSRRRRRSTDGGSYVAAEVYEVSVSNDGSTFGSSSEVIALDTTCLTYSGTGDNITITLDSNYCLIDGLCYQNGTNLTGQTCSFCDRSLDPYSWTLHSDYCLIDDVCYPNGTLKSSDACKVCLTTADSTDWTTDNVTDSCVQKDSVNDSGIKGYVIAIIVLSVVLVLGGSGVGGYFLLKKYQASRAMGQGLFDNVRRPKFALRIEPTKSTLIDLEKKEHPPPELYQQLDIPQTPTDRVPDNLYTERENDDHRLPEPVLPNIVQNK